MEATDQVMEEQDTAPPEVVVEPHVDTGAAAGSSSSDDNNAAEAAAPAAPVAWSAAGDRAKEMTQEVIISDLERMWIKTRDECDQLKMQLQTTQGQLQEAVASAVSQRELQGQLEEQRHLVELGRKRIDALQEECKLAQERIDRSQAEGDSLREEISRLTKANEDFRKQFSSMETQCRLQESEAIPLFHEKQRLQTELDSLQAHANWLNQELESKSKDYLHLKQEAWDRTMQSALQLEQTTAEKDAAEARLEAYVHMEQELQSKVQQVSKDLLAAKHELVAVRENSDLALQEEKRLVEMQKEHLERWQQRYNDVVRQNETLKESAALAMEQSEKDLQQVRDELEAKYKNLLEEQAASYEEKLRAQPVSSALTASTRVAALDLDDQEPMSMTDLYTSWQETKVALQQETIYRKHWELQFTRLQKEIEDTNPRMQRQVRDYERALDKVQDYERRLQQTITARDDALQDAREAQQEVSMLRQALATRKMESEELAKQVQALLVSRVGGRVDGSIPTSVSEMQNQNQRLLVEQRRLSQQVEELNAKLDEDELRRKLEAQESELATLRQQRVEQESLVEQIAVQRDLYKSLLATKDHNILDSSGEESNAVAIARHQSERSRNLEVLNRELESKLTAAQSEADRLKNDKESISDRLAGLDTYTAELRKTMDGLERDLIAARGEAARAASDAEYHKERCGRVEESLERARGELQHIANTKKELQKLNAELQQSLVNANSLTSSLEEEKRRMEGNMRLVKAQLEAAKKAEARALEENSQLRSELSRQGGIMDSVRRIETSLTAKSESEKEGLKDEVERLSKKLADEQVKYGSQVENLNSRVQESEMRIRDLESAKETAVANALESEKSLLEAKAELKSVASKCSALELQLKEAKERLGENADTEDQGPTVQARIDDLSAQLHSANAELASMKERVTHYQKISKDSEDALLQLRSSIARLQQEKESEATEFRSRMDQMREADASKQAFIKELTEDLAGEREKRETLATSLQQEIENLKAELKNNDKDLESSRAAASALRSDLENLRNECASAHKNYERELELHSQARTLLREAREKAEEDANLRHAAEQRAEQFKRELEQQREVWDQEKASMSDAQIVLEQSLSHAREQNSKLLAQLETLTNMQEKHQTSGDVSTSEALDKAQESNDVADLKNVITELREVVKFLRSENDLIRTQLDTAKRAAERERLAVAIVRRSLDESRAELKILQDEKEASGGADKQDLAAKLSQAEELTKLLTDSNRLLRDESERVQARVRSLQSELDEAKATAQPSEAIKQELSRKISTLEVEKDSLTRELDSWKSRVNSLVSKFNQIDPEEHKMLQAKVAELEKEKESTTAWIKVSGDESSRLRTIANNLKLKAKEQTDLIKRQKSDLEKLSAENARLTDASVVDSAAAKERDSLRTVVDKMKKDAESAEKELDGANKQNERLRGTLRKFQTEIRELKAKEAELAAQLATAQANLIQIKSSVSSPEAGEKSGQEEKGSKEPSSEKVAEILLPSVPTGGFHFGPSETAPKPKDISQSVAAEKAESLPEDCPAVVSMVATPFEATADSLPTKAADLSGAEGGTPGESKISKNESEEGTAINLRRMSGETKELSMKEKLFRKKQQLVEAKRKREALLKATSTSESGNVSKKPKLEEKEGVSSPQKTTEVNTSGDVSVIQEASSAVEENQDDEDKIRKDVDVGTEEHSPIGTATMAATSAGEKTTGKVMAADKDFNDTPGKGTSDEMDVVGVKAVPPVESFAKEGRKDDQGATTLESPFATSSMPAPTIFGHAATAGQGLSFGFASKAGQSAPFGALGGQILDLKPPGSGNPVPTFSFGSSSNIILPTPSQLLPVPSPFSAFGSGMTFGQAFGSSAVTSSAPQALPLFGSLSAVKEAKEKSDDKEEGELS